MTIDRAQLRRELRAKRRALTPAQRIGGADALAARLFDLPFAPKSGFVAGYWAMDGEIALHAWQVRLPDDCIYCLPVLNGDVLSFAPWSPGESLVTNRYGIPEPDVAADALLPANALAFIAIPLVGFDPAGRRLGMGGGWYDRTLAFRRDRAAPPWLVGVGFDEQCVDALDAEDWDVAPDALCTPSRTYRSESA